MKLVLSNKTKVIKFTNIFKYINNISKDVLLTVKSDGLHTQGLDTANICLFDINIKSEWFDKYEFDKKDPGYFNLGLSCELIFKLFSCIRDGQQLEIVLKPDKPDYMFVNFVNSNDMDKSFEIRLLDMDPNNLEVPIEEAELDLLIETSEFKRLISEMTLFSDNVDFVCNSDEDHLELTGTGTLTGKMTVKIKDENVKYFGILEDTNLNVRFDTKYLHDIVNLDKIAPYLHISCSNNKPIIINYIIDEIDFKSTQEEDLLQIKNFSCIRMALAPKEDENTDDF
jgi:proliferating cell nuclear antigen PCNA